MSTLIYCKINYYPINTISYAELLRGKFHDGNNCLNASKRIDIVKYVRLLLLSLSIEPLYAPFFFIAVFQVTRLNQHFAQFALFSAIRDVTQKR